MYRTWCAESKFLSRSQTPILCHFTKEIMAVVSLDDILRGIPRSNSLFPRNIVEVQGILPRVEKIRSDSTTFFSRNRVFKCELCLSGWESAIDTRYVEIVSWCGDIIVGRTEKLLPNSSSRFRNKERDSLLLFFSLFLSFPPWYLRRRNGGRSYLPGRLKAELPFFPSPLWKMHLRERRTRTHDAILLRRPRTTDALFLAFFEVSGANKNKLDPGSNSVDALP